MRDVRGLKEEEEEEEDIEERERESDSEPEPESEQESELFSRSSQEACGEVEGEMEFLWLICSGEGGDVGEDILCLSGGEVGDSEGCERCEGCSDDGGGEGESEGEDRRFFLQRFLGDGTSLSDVSVPSLP